MSVTVRNYEHSPGRYWVSVLVPEFDAGGVTDEHWSEPLPATIDEHGQAWVDGWQSPLCFEWQVVQREVVVPALPVPSD